MARKRPIPGTVPGKPIPALPTVCVACHREDDFHHGALGPQCERCHVTGTWRDIKPFGRATGDRAPWQFAAGPRTSQ